MNKTSFRFSHSSNRHVPISDHLESFFSDRKNSEYNRFIVQTYPAHATIFLQDTPANTVYLVEHGVVKLVRVAPNGHHVITGLRRRHWMIGAPSVLLEKPYSFTGITLVPSSLRVIPAKDFLDLAKENKQFSWYLLQMLSRKIFNHMKKVEAMSCMSAQERLERFLCDMIDELNPVGAEPASVSLPLNNKELAQLLAITPEHLCRVLKKMENKGIIRRDNGILTVTDPESLVTKSLH
jgi:CRP-like cAMP-binding protein